MKIELRRREVSETPQFSGVSPLLSRLYASRGICSDQSLERGLVGLLKWDQLIGIDAALTLLIEALHQQQRIVIVGDFDADGATSTTLMLQSLKSFGFNQVDYLVPNRFEDGYGLSPEVVDQVNERGADLIITVDNGISSHQGVDRAHEYGMKVLVTDHHLPGDTLPAAEAIVNPNLHQCDFPSKALAGVGVAFYLMMALRRELQNQHYFETHNLAIPNLAEYLDLVALGTVADVVALDDNNRILVHQGLNRIRAGRCRPGIKALLEIAKRDAANLVATDLGFALGPRLNAAGRLDNMSVGVSLLLCNEMPQARMLANELDALNLTRREIEEGMQQEALAICDKLEFKEGEMPYGLALSHKDWHQGVVGIVASRIKERFHRPVIAFAPAGDDELKGSGRSIQGLHMRDALDRLDILYPGLIIKFGGHAMAAGLSIKKDKFEQFQMLFSELVSQWLEPAQLDGVIYSDGELLGHELTLATAEELRAGGPWGQAFPEPIFDGEFRILQQRLLKDKHLKLMLEPIKGGPLVDAIWFNIDNKQWPDNSIKSATIAYRLDINEFRGNRNIQLMIEHIWPH